MEDHHLGEPLPHCITIVRALPGLGDMLCIVPALRALRAALPKAHVTLIGLPQARDFVQRFSVYLVALVEKLSDEDLTDPDRLGPYLDPAWTEGLTLWQCIAADSYEHYRDHMPTIRTWLSEQKASEERPGEL